MDNTAYIKSLEERIEKLEKILGELKLENSNLALTNSESITFSNCQIQAVALQKCKDVSIQQITADNFGLAAYSAKIENAHIDSMENKSNKTKMSNCTINDTGGLK